MIEALGRTTTSSDTSATQTFSYSSREKRGTTIEILDDPDLHVPHLVDLEVISVLRRLRSAGQMDERRAALALKDLVELALVRHPHWPLAARIWELRNNLTPYDAAYAALAEALGCPLVTGNRRISRASSIRCEVETL